MSDDKKEMVEPGVYLEGFDALTAWLKEVWKIEPIESTVHERTVMMLGFNAGRPLTGSVDDYTDLSSVLIYGVMGYAEIGTQGSDGRPAVAGQMGPILHTMGIIEKMVFTLSGIYFLNGASKRDRQFARDYDDNMKHLVAAYSGIQLATPDQMPKGPIGIIR